MTPTGMYLPSLAYMRAMLRSDLGLDSAPEAEKRPNRAVIRGAWGEQTLTVPLAGGRQSAGRHGRDLTVSEHGNWRHAHWQAITSAYGRLPYFHFLEAPFARIYASGERRFDALCASLHEAVMDAAGLPDVMEWLREHPRPLRLPDDAELFPRHVSVIELLFSRGPESVFYLLGD